MLTFASANEQLDDLLEELCLGLALNDTQHARATRAYETVGAWISADDSPLASWEPLLFPQGSIPLGTAVKPRSKEEFDADGVCLFQNAHGLSAQRAYDLVRDRLLAHETYREKLTSEERCLRVNYEGQLHLDVIPAIQAPSGGGAILVPKSGRIGWQSSNPIGFQRWFDERRSGHVLSEKLAQVVPMPPSEPPRNRSPLQRTVQLFKRRREVYFDGSESAPKSILLTTIVAQEFAGERLVTDATVNALQRIQKRFPSYVVPAPVWNPSNVGENLARQWHEEPGTYRTFVEFAQDFLVRTESLLAQTGMEKIARMLKELFDPGDTGIVEAALHGYTSRLQEQRLAGCISVSRGTGSLATRASAAPVAGLSSIPSNRFFGR